MDKYEAASIEWDGYVRGSDDPIAAYKFQMVGETLWFVATPQVAQNERDYAMLISQFGFGEKESVGCTGSGWLRPLDVEVVEKIQRHISEFFLNDKNKHLLEPGLGVGRCRNVIFNKNWVNWAI